MTRDAIDELADAILDRLCDLIADDATAQRGGRAAWQPGSLPVRVASGVEDALVTDLSDEDIDAMAAQLLGAVRSTEEFPLDRIEV